MSKYALITVIEGNYNSINFKNNNTPRLLEDEAIKCFKSWRKYGGKLKDIDVYCICISGNTPTEKTINQLRALNVKYIEHYMPETKAFNNGWWNKPLGCAILEQQLVSYDFFIHIDLDMYLCKEINFEINRNICLVYDKYDLLEERKFTDVFKNNFKPFNTCFIVAERKFKIFEAWYKQLLKLEISYVTYSNYFKKYFTDIEYSKLEEGAFDILSLDESYNLFAIENVMFGETYTALKDMTSTNNVCFHHYHLYDKYDLNRYNFIKNKILFVNEYS